MTANYCIPAPPGIEIGTSLFNTRWCGDIAISQNALAFGGTENKGIVRWISKKSI